jgi:hypothetical protein
MSFVNSMHVDSMKSSRDVVSAIRCIAQQIQSRRANVAVLLLSSAGAATVHANRIPELRAIVGTTAESVEAAIKSIAPNVLIVERSTDSFTELRNIFARFFRGGGA